MIRGSVRDLFPRVTLSLPGDAGSVDVEFVVDTGFEGELALPPTSLADLDVAPVVNSRLIRLADGSYGLAATYEILLEWADEPRPVSILLLDGNPLLGAELLAGHVFHSEMTNGGEVLIEPL